MGIFIEDGKGRGFIAQVDSEGHLVVDALTTTEIAHTSLAHALAFSWAATTYNYSAADTILLVKNTDTDRVLFIDMLWISSDTTTEVAIHVPTTVVATPTGTTVNARNFDTTSGRVAAATAMRDETANTQGDVYWSGFILANTMNQIDMRGVLFLGTNESIGIDYVTAGTGCAATIFGYFE